MQKLEIFYHNCNLPPIPNGADYESIASTVESNDEYTTCTWCGNKRYVWCERCQKANVMRLVRDYSTAMKGFNIGGPWVEGRPIGIPKHLKLLPTDTHPLDDMAIMAAISLIKLTATPYPRFWAKPHDFEMRHGHQRLIQAAALLEFAHSKSAANNQILLLLSRFKAIRLDTSSLTEFLLFIHTQFKMRSTALLRLSIQRLISPAFSACTEMSAARSTTTARDHLKLEATIQFANS
jgi:hypothetical protein